MASSGAAAWAKHYQGKGDLATTIKKTGNTYDANGRAQSTQLEAGTPCIVLASTVYDSKPQIRVMIGGRQQVVRFKFDDITKPGNRSSGAASLKPQAFNVITTTPIQLSEYKKRALAALDERTDLDGPLKGYLAQLIEYWSGNNAAKTKAAKIWTAIQNNIPINDINKDFGEVLGPLAVIKHNILAGTGHEKEVNATSGIYIPARPNEPLMDYKVGNIVISAKSGVTTNTVKAQDILNLLHKRPAIERKYKPTDEWQVLNILAANSTKAGPISAARIMLGDKYNAWERNNTYLKSKKGKFTDLELMYECEKYLQAESKTGRLNFTKLFADAIKGNVVYVKFALDQTGVGKFEAIVSQDVLKAATGARPFLRSKNGYTRAADKLGIQI